MCNNNYSRCRMCAYENKEKRIICLNRKSYKKLSNLNEMIEYIGFKKKAPVGNIEATDNL